jgi:hypothetical protein
MPTWSGCRSRSRPPMCWRCAPLLDGWARPNLGIVLKIETRRGFEHLPEMLLAAMAGPVPA